MTSLVESRERTSPASVLRKAVRSGVSGVSFATDQSTIDALFRSRESLPQVAARPSQVRKGRQILLPNRQESPTTPSAPAGRQHESCVRHVDSALDVRNCIQVPSPSPAMSRHPARCWRVRRGTALQHGWIYREEIQAYHSEICQFHALRSCEIPSCHRGYRLHRSRRDRASAAPVSTT